MKRSSSIYSAVDVPDFESRFAEITGLGWREVARASFADADAEYGWMLAGSIAEQCGHPASDIDIIVLPPLRATRPHLASGELALKVGDRTEGLKYVSGLELNWEVLDQNFAGRVRRALSGMTQLLSDRTAKTELPVLAMRDIRTLHRVRVGWILDGRETIDEWREYLLITTLPAYLAVVHFVNFCEMREDLLSVLSAKTFADWTLIPMWQMACRDALMCANAVTGTSTNPSEKWAGLSGSRLVPPAQQVFSIWHDTVLDGRQFMKDPLGSIRRLSDQIGACLELDPLVKHACGVLGKFVHYADFC